MIQSLFKDQNIPINLNSDINGTVIILYNLVFMWISVISIKMG